MIRVALVDDHPLIRKILRQELSRSTDLSILWEAEDTADIMPQLAGQTPDVLVLDLNFAGKGFEPVTAVRDMRARFPALAILILTALDDPIWIEELLKAGAAGYVVKSDDLSLRLAEAIRAVAQGRPFLSPTAAGALTHANRRYALTSRERAILRLAAEGRSNPEIADLIGVSDGTVRNHISNIYAKLEVDNREAAIRAAQHMRELPKPGAALRHELRTPLHTLLGLARLLHHKLTRNGQLDSSDAETLALLVAEAERLDGLIDDLASH
jgi:DNA-binding NarL/FixJ family response regulator